MSEAYQLDLFSPIPDEIDILRSQIIELKNMAHNVRKRTFADLNGMGKELIILKDICERQERRLNMIEKTLGLKQDNNYFQMELEAVFGNRSK